MGKVSFPAIPEKSRNGTAGFSRDSRSSYIAAGTPGTGIGNGGNEQITAHLWRVTVPEREPFLVWCMQGATAADVLEVWVGAVVEALP